MYWDAQIFKTAGVYLSNIISMASHSHAKPAYMSMAVWNLPWPAQSCFSEHWWQLKQANLGRREGLGNTDGINCLRDCVVLVISAHSCYRLLLPVAVRVLQRLMSDCCTKGCSNECPSLIIHLYDCMTSGRRVLLVKMRCLSVSENLQGRTTATRTTIPFRRPLLAFHLPCHVLLASLRVYPLGTVRHQCCLHALWTY